MEVVLREVRDEDVLAFHEHQRDEEATRLAAFPSRDLDAHLAHWDRIRADRDVITRAIEADGTVVGNIGSWVQDGRREVGYWLDRAVWGRGIATEALGAFVRELVDRPLFAHVAVGNLGSIRVLERCGFTPVPGHRPEAGEDGVVELLYTLPE